MGPANRGWFTAASNRLAAQPSDHEAIVPCTLLPGLTRWGVDWARRGRSGRVGDVSHAAFEASHNLHHEIVGGSGVVRQEYGAGPAARADVAERVEVLSEEDKCHDVLGR